LKEIALTQGKVALVDDSDFERLSRHKWCAHKNKPHATWYARRQVAARSGTTKQRAVFMHREILGLEFGDKTQADHQDGNGLNNQRYNLRRSSQSQNQHNQKPYRIKKYSRFKGVTQDKLRTRSWMVQITNNNRKRIVGCFRTEEAAALAYNEYAKLNFGEFARLNVLEPIQ